MKRFKIENFTKGWFIGNFEPSIIKTKDFEVAVKFYKKGEQENSHVHKIADEFTVITFGKCRMNNQILKKGDIIWIEKGESTDFEALEECATTVVKIPSVLGDKYVV